MFNLAKKYYIKSKSVTKCTEDEKDSIVKQAKEYVDIEIDKILDGVSENFDTLRELADAINNDPNFYLNISNEIKEKIDRRN